MICLCIYAYLHVVCIYVEAAQLAEEANMKAVKRQEEHHPTTTTTTTTRHPTTQCQHSARSKSPTPHQHRPTTTTSATHKLAPPTYDNNGSGEDPTHRRSHDQDAPVNMRFRDTPTMHSSRISDDGTQLHDHDFIVHTGGDILLGRSDSPKHEIHAPGTPNGFMYETESDHASLQGHPGLHVDRHQFGHTIQGQLSKSVNAIELNQVTSIPSHRRRPPPTPDTWKHMAHALRVLRDKGYDPAEADMYLPMVEAEYVYPDMEEAFEKFYLHIRKRLTPASRAEEPQEIVDAALEFVEAYEIIRDIV
jgi:hypothetical protein